MKLLEDKTLSCSCVGIIKKFRVQIDCDDAATLDRANKIMKRIEKKCGIDRKMADMTEISYEVNTDKNIATIRMLQGANG